MNDTDRQDAEQLPPRYSFRADGLRDHFLSEAQKLNLDQVLLAKQHDLLLFRQELVKLSTDFPSLLFSFDHSSDPEDLAALKLILKFEPDPVDYDLSVVLCNVYPHVNWLTRFFTISTFPAMFCHFLSEEYITAAARFLIAHMNDRLIDPLVGTFLRHNFLFRDRLFQFFIEEIASATDALTSHVLFQCLLTAFRRAIPYFSESHIQVILVLRAKNESAAAHAVIGEFLVETLELWKCSGSLCCALGILGSLDDLIATDLKNAANTKAILDCFGYDVLLQPPQIGRAIFSGGVKFALSLVDVNLMRQIAGIVQASLSGEARKTVSGNVDTVLNDAFVIRTTLSDEPSSTVKIPDAPRATQFSLAKLRFHRDFHNALFSLSGGLRHLQTVVEATKSVLLLHGRAYFWSWEVQPDEFARDQRGKYGLALIKTLCSPEALAFLNTKQYDSQKLTTEVSEKIERRLGKTSRPARSIVNTTADYIKDIRHNLGSPGQLPRPHVVPERDCVYAEYFVQALDAAVLALGLDHLAKTSVFIDAKFAGLAPEKRIEEVKNWVKQFETPNTKSHKKRSRRATDITSIVSWASDGFKHMLLASDPAVTTGRRVLFLIELEPLLQSLFAAGGGGAEAEFSAAMCADQEVGVKVVRAVMAQAIGILKKWKSGHHLLGKGQIEDLRKWFGLETVP